MTQLRDAMLANGGQPEIWFEFNPNDGASGLDGSGYGERGDFALYNLAGSAPTIAANGPGGSHSATFDGLSRYRSGGTSLSYGFAMFNTSAFGVWVKGGTGTVWNFNTGSGSTTTGYVRLDADANGAYVIRGGSSTAIATSATGINNDGNWHFVVWQRTSDTEGTLYVDGQSVSNVTNAALTEGISGWLYIADNGYTAYGSNFNGAMAMPFHYPGGLTATQISNQYIGGTTAPGGYTAQVMTANATMPGGSTVLPKTVTATPMTANALMPDAAATMTRTALVAEDTYVSTIAPNTTHGSSQYLGVSTAYTTLVKMPAVGASETLMGAKLRLVSSGNYSSVTFTFKAITSPWDESTIYNSAPTMTGSVTVTTALTNGQELIVDVTPLLASATHGIAVMTNSSEGRFFDSSESTTSANRPYFEQTYVNPIPQPADVAPLPMTATALFNDATVFVETVISPTPFIATVEMPNPEVVAIHPYTHDAESMDAYVEYPGGAFARYGNVTAEPFTATALLNDPVVTTASAVNFAATPMTATSKWVKPESVNGNPIVISETEDNYFNRVMALDPSYWLRMTDTGSTLTNRANQTTTATFGGTVLKGRFNGPEGRPSIYLDGTGYIEQIEDYPTNIDEMTTTSGDLVATAIEFSVKTTKQNQFIFAGADNSVTPAGVASPGGGQEVFMQDGKIGFRTYRYNSGNPSQVGNEFTGFKNIADGAWHHIVIRSGVTNNWGEIGVEIHIDGKLEVRRYQTSSLIGFPDYIGYRPNEWSGDNVIIPDLPANYGYVGELSEIVMYKTDIPSAHDLNRNYYAFMGWTPVEASVMSGTAAMPEARGKGSQRRALYLYWNPLDEVFRPSPAGGDSTSYDPIPGFAESAYSDSYDPFFRTVKVGDYFGFKVFGYSVTGNPAGGDWRDQVTDEHSLINLETDIDLDDFDLIMFKDWPDESSLSQGELDSVNTVYPGQKERLIEQLRDANERGISLLVTNPRMALDLGIVDDIEWVAPNRESKFTNNQGNAAGYYDYGSALKFPWNIAASDGLTGRTYASGIGEEQNLEPAYLDNKAHFYWDTNHNNRFRVRALIEGLTDIPGYMLEDAVWHTDYDEWGWQGAAYKYLEREEGLQIGDEFIYPGTSIIDGSLLDIVDRRFQRWAGSWATPPGAVKAGTVVTTFGANYWHGKSLIDNPYKDYATTIVLQPGDTLGGRPVGGRIYVNFTEQPTSHGEALAFQLLPVGDEGWPQGYAPETAAQREWQWSWTRTSLTVQGRELLQSVAVTMPDGTTQVISMVTGSELAMVRSGHIFPITYKSRMDMNMRGVLWMLNAPVVEEGSATVRADAMTADATMPQPAVTATRTNTVRVQPMYATATMQRVLESTVGEAAVLALPMTATARFTGYGRTLSAAPMLATALMVEPFDAVHVSGEQVALTLHNREVSLFIKEEAQ